MRFSRFLSYLTIGILVPIALIFLGVRILLSNTFLNLEYRMPGFPQDNYGFTLEERLKWADYALQYLVNNTNINFLGDLTFVDGSPLFNERELNHMVDVKKVVKPMIIVGYTSWFLLAGFGIYAFRFNKKQDYLHGLRFGGMITIGLLIVIGLFAMINFWNFFTLFHGIFFEGDSWLFLFSDTLIRLFPMRFWQDAFIIVGLITLGGGLALMLGLRPRH